MNGEHLKKARKAQRLTQKQLADASGTSLRMIQYYEQGASLINKAEAETVCRIAEALGTTVREILD